MKKLLCLSCGLLLAASVAQAQVIAKWTFESSVPTTAGPHAAEVGSGSAFGSHANPLAVYSNPVGNGSLESFSANYWSVGDYWQFQTSTLGFESIKVSWDQTSSSTGPGSFDLRYSTDGVNFTSFATYSVLQNGLAPNPSWSSLGGGSSAYSFSFDLSSVLSLNNADTVFFRLVDNATTTPGGGTVATAGADRVDNFTVAVVPEPSTLALLGLSAALVALRRRNS